MPNVIYTVAKIEKKVQFVDDNTGRGHMARVMTLCDLTQSYAETGGGIRTYLTEKRSFIDQNTAHKHLLIIPGEKDEVSVEGRHTTVRIKSPRVPGSPKYRLLLRSKSVIRTLHEHGPDTVECLDAYNLPWAALKYKSQAGDVALIAGYRTDFPTVYVEEISRKFTGAVIARRLKARAYKYAGNLYSRFDGVYALSADMAKNLMSLGVAKVDILPLGTDLNIFNPNMRDQDWRDKLGAHTSDPVLIYAGRLDKEKQADIVLDAFLQLPKSLNASLVLLGEGNLIDPLRQKSNGSKVHFPGFIANRDELAGALASSDIYVSAMAHETFGISIIEAQAAGLPIVGVSAGAMIDRVPPELGLLGAKDDPTEMAKNIESLWTSGKAATIGKRARKHVEEHFSWEKTFEYLFNSIYRNATGLDVLA